MPVLGHHSFKAQYDETQPITLNGTVTKLIWKNPHVLLDVDVKGGTGEVTKWELELDSPNGLLSQGWKVDSFKAGDRVIVSGYRAKNGSNSARARKVTLAAR
jgi:hypothetical protein